jgi:hypothetical protein
MTSRVSVPPAGTGTLPSRLTMWQEPKHRAYGADMLMGGFLSTAVAIAPIPLS